MSRSDKLSEDERAIFSLLGAIRFDAPAVANILRTRPLSKVEAWALANLLEDKHADGLRLELHGQGKGWRPWKEAASSFDRLVAIGQSIEKRILKGEKMEDAIIDLNLETGLSEPTLYRDLRLYRQLIADSD